MSKVIRGEGPFECGEIKWERTSVKNNKSPVVTPIIEETPVINPVIDVHPDVTTAGMQHEIEHTKLPYETGSQGIPTRKILVLEFSGYVTDGDHVLVIRDIENGKITKNIEINKGHQYSTCSLTVDQIMKIYGFLIENNSEKAYIKKQKENKPYHFSQDDNLVVFSEGKEVILSKIKNYENPELQKALEDKFKYEEDFKAKDADILRNETHKKELNNSKLAKVRNKVARVADKIAEVTGTEKIVQKFTDGKKIADVEIGAKKKAMEKKISDKLFGKVNE